MKKGFDESVERKESFQKKVRGYPKMIFQSGKKEKSLKPKVWGNAKGLL